GFPRISGEYPYIWRTECFHNPPESLKKLHISYSKHQKLLLQKYFDKCMCPSQDEHEMLGHMIGVTEPHVQEIELGLTCEPILLLI
ncbi:hypothetical protein ACQP3C_26910, partial [Escherichia coli]